jgi:hypothetical protein
MRDDVSASEWDRIAILAQEIELNTVNKRKGSERRVGEYSPDCAAHGLIWLTSAYNGNIFS